MPSFADSLRVLNEMKMAGVVEDYAVAGAMALAFWTEPIPTFDLDVLVLLPGTEPTIVSLAPLYRWTADRGYAAQAEHVMIEGVPVQFLPAHNELADEAIERAVTLDYEGGMAHAPQGRPRASAELMAALHAGKSTFHRERSQLPLREKIRLILYLQHVCLPLIKRGGTIYIICTWGGGSVLGGGAMVGAGVILITGPSPQAEAPTPSGPPI